MAQVDGEQIWRWAIQGIPGLVKLMGRLDQDPSGPVAAAEMIDTFEEYIQQLKDIAASQRRKREAKAQSTK